MLSKKEINTLKFKCFLGNYTGNTTNTVRMFLQRLTAHSIENKRLNLKDNINHWEFNSCSNGAEKQRIQ